jgi:hypothetical protein
MDYHIDDAIITNQVHSAKICVRKMKTAKDIRKESFTAASWLQLPFVHKKNLSTHMMGIIQNLTLLPLVVKVDRGMDVSSKRLKVKLLHFVY